MERTAGLLRSWMFVPGDRQRMIDKALTLGVDAIMLDLEDGIAPAEKDTARRQIAASLDRIAASDSAALRTPVRYVRINAIGHDGMNLDLASAVRPGLQGLALPKVEAPDQVELVARLLDEREAEMQLAPGTVRVLIAIESPLGLFNAYAIARASPRVVGLMFGAEDFGKELGLPLRRDGEARDLLYARSALVTAAAAAHVQAVDGVWPDLADVEGLPKFAAQSRRLGFTGMSLIHPSQIDPVNAAFTPTAEDVAYCRRVLDAFEQAQSRGEGTIAFGGQLLNLPIVDRARQTLSLAASLGAQAS